MSMPRTHFVQELPLTSTARERHIEQAKARSHAASVSHSTRRREVRHSRPSLELAELLCPGQAPLNTPLPPLDLTSYGIILQHDAMGVSSNSSRYQNWKPLLPPQPYPWYSIQRFSQTSGGAGVAPRNNEHRPLHRNDHELDIDPAENDDVDSVSTENPLYTDQAFLRGSIAAASNAPAENAKVNQQTTLYTQSSVPIARVSRSRRSLARGVPHDRLGYRSDPFNVMPVRGMDTRRFASLRDYYVQVLAPNVAPVSKIVSRH
jgi:hypothetical protein